MARRRPIRTGWRKSSVVWPIDARSNDGGKTWEPVGNEFKYDGVPGTHMWYDGAPGLPWEFRTRLASRTVALGSRWRSMPAHPGMLALPLTKTAAALARTARPAATIQAAMAARCWWNIACTQSSWIPASTSSRSRPQAFQTDDGGKPGGRLIEASIRSTFPIRLVGPRPSHCDPARHPQRPFHRHTGT